MRLKLESQFDGYSIFSDVGTNPTFDTCENAVEFCDGKMFDGVIALGGGSVMDLAKVVIAKLSLGKNKIRAFDTIGPAFVIHNEILFKVLSYSNESKGFNIELLDGVIYPETIIPEGKRKMSAEDYIRGNNGNFS